MAVKINLWALDESKAKAKRSSIGMDGFSDAWSLNLNTEKKEDTGWKKIFSTKKETPEERKMDSSTKVENTSYGNINNNQQAMWQPQAWYNPYYMPHPMQYAAYNPYMMQGQPMMAPMPMMPQMGMIPMPNMYPQMGQHMNMQGYDPNFGNPQNQNFNQGEQQEITTEEIKETTIKENKKSNLSSLFWDSEIPETDDNADDNILSAIEEVSKESLQNEPEEKEDNLMSSILKEEPVIKESSEEQTKENNIISERSEINLIKEEEFSIQDGCTNQNLSVENSEEIFKNYACEEDQELKDVYIKTKIEKEESKEEVSEEIMEDIIPVTPMIENADKEEEKVITEITEEIKEDTTNKSEDNISESATVENEDLENTHIEEASINEETGNTTNIVRASEQEDYKKLYEELLAKVNKIEHLVEGEIERNKNISTDTHHIVEAELIEDSSPIAEDKSLVISSNYKEETAKEEKASRFKMPDMAHFRTLYIGTAAFSFVLLLWISAYTFNNTPNYWDLKTSVINWTNASNEGSSEITLDHELATEKDINELDDNDSIEEIIIQEEDTTVSAEEIIETPQEEIIETIIDENPVVEEVVIEKETNTPQRSRKRSEDEIEEEDIAELPQEQKEVEVITTQLSKKEKEEKVVNDYILTNMIK